MTNNKVEKLSILETLLVIENILYMATSDDYGRYVKAGLELDPNAADMLGRKGTCYLNKLFLLCNI